MNWVIALSEPGLVCVDDEIEAEACGCGVPEPYHLPEFPRRIDVKHRKREAPKRLQCEMKEHARILADGIEKNRVPTLCADLPDDLDRLRFELG
jgi:hypothetical protein